MKKLTMLLGVMMCCVAVGCANPETSDKVKSDLLANTGQATKEVVKNVAKGYDSMKKVEKNESDELFAVVAEATKKTVSMAFSMSEAILEDNVTSSFIAKTANAAKVLVNEIAK